MKSNYQYRINYGGNYCLHDPLNPAFELKKLIPTGKRGLPDVLTRPVLTFQQKFWDSPHLLPCLNTLDNVDRQTRTERREAIIICMAAILTSTDVTTLRVGINTPDGFKPYSWRQIWLKTNISWYRFKRAIRALKAAGLLTVTQKREKNMLTGRWKAYVAIKSVSKRVWGLLGMKSYLERQRKHHSKRLKEQQIKWLANDAGTITGKEKVLSLLEMEGYKSHKPKKYVDDKSKSSGQNILSELRLLRFTAKEMEKAMELLRVNPHLSAHQLLLKIRS